MISRTRAIACTEFDTHTNIRECQYSALEIDASPTYVSNSADAAIWHATQGGGITMALSYQVADHLKDGRLKLLLPELEPAPYPVQFVYPSSRLLSLKVRALLEHTVSTRDWNFMVLPGCVRPMTAPE